MSILSSARNAKNASLSKKIFNDIQSKFSDIESGLISATVLLANTYALSGDKAMATNTRTKLIGMNAKKKIGLSWTVVNGKIFVFEFRNYFKKNLNSFPFFI